MAQKSLDISKFVIVKLFMYYKHGGGGRGGVVVKALRYKPAGRVFDSRWCHDFSP